MSLSCGIVLLARVAHCATRAEDFVRAYLVRIVMTALVWGGTMIVVRARPVFAYGLIFGHGHEPNTLLPPVCVSAIEMLAVATMTVNPQVGASNLLSSRGRR